MKKRMTRLALLLAGGVMIGSYGGLTVRAAEQAVNAAPVAGISGVFGEFLMSEGVLEIANQLVDAGESEGGQQEKKESESEGGQQEEKENESEGGQQEKRMEDTTQVSETVSAETSAHEIPEVASEYADIAIAQVNNYVNVRLEPNTESEILGKLYNNSAATVLEATEDGWYRIHSGNVEGYVKAEYVVVGDEELARSVGTRYATVATTTLFVRSQPTTEASILTMLPEGDDLVVSDESVEGWAQVSTVEGDGYISTDYVTLETEYTHAESKAEEEARLAREEAERQAAARAAEKARRAREDEARKVREEEARKAREEQAKRQEIVNAASGSGNSGSAAGNNAGQSSTGAGNSGESNGGSTGSNHAGNSMGAGNSGGSNGGSIGGNHTGNDSEGSSSGNVSGSTAGNAVSNGQAVVNYGMKFLGNPYVFGGTSLTNGADCSGFVQSVYAAFGVSLPRNSAAQRSAGYAVSMSDIQPGDIVCYSGHVGIYAGNNTLLHASNERTGITLTSPITYRPVLAVRRIF